MNNVLEVEHVVKEYESGVRAVDDVSFCLPRGGFWSIMGASGSGKTTWRSEEHTSELQSHLT